MEQFRSSGSWYEGYPQENSGAIEDDPKKKKAEVPKPKESEKKVKKEEQKKSESEKSAEVKKSKKEVEPEREKPEKTVEEKRETLVEQARELTQRYEDEPIPRDAVVVARLLVAQHILSLDEQIESPRNPEEIAKREALLASVDYMGELAEKLENPLKEVSPDIEAACAMVLGLAEAALTDTAPEILVAQNEAVTKEYLAIIAEPQLEGLAVEIELQNRSTTPISPLVQHLLTLRRNAAAVTASDPSGSLPFSSGSTPAARASLKSTPTANRPSVRNLETRPSPENPSASVIPPLAAAAAIAASLHREKPHTGIRNAESPATNSNETVPTREQIIQAALSPDYTPTISSPPEETSGHDALPSRPAEATLFPATPDQPSLTFQQTKLHSFSEQLPTSSREPAKPKLEHLPITTLLTMAENIPIGYGRYLRREFEAGNIDKEGLIKVLKSRAKGKDFFVEFQNQTTRFQTLKATSPEFLKTSAPTIAPLPPEPITQNVASAPPTPPPSRTPSKPTLPKPIPISTESKVAKENSQPDWQQKLDQISPKTWVAAIALASVILLLLVLSLTR
jgi:hypothetical protein